MKEYESIRHQIQIPRGVVASFEIHIFLFATEFIFVCLFVLYVLLSGIKKRTVALGRPMSGRVSRDPGASHWPGGAEQAAIVVSDWGLGNHQTKVMSQDPTVRSLDWS